MRTRPVDPERSWRGHLHERIKAGILAGVLVTPLGLESTFEIFGSVVATLALAVALEAYRTRPASARLAVETA